MQFSLEFPDILGQHYTCYQGLSVSGISKRLHRGIPIKMPYCIGLGPETVNAVVQ